MLIDTHFHLPDNINELESEIRRAKENNVNYMILGGTNKEENIIMIDITRKYNNIFLTLGYHPEYADIIKEEDLKLLEDQIQNNNIIAIGEIGLDYHYENSNKNNQQKLFISQLELARKYNLPVVIHSRDATEDTYNILKKYNLNGVIHCYSGSLEMAKRYIDLGYKLGIGGVLTFKNSKLKDVVKNIDLKNIILETDSPYLSPDRGNINEPSNIKIIAEYLAEITDKSLEEIAKITTNNAVELLSIVWENVPKIFKH